MNELVRRGYDEAALRYSAYRDQFKSQRPLDLLVERLRPGSAILDIGCGSGRPVDSYLAGKGFKVTGIDISDAQIALARQNVPDAEYAVRDMSTLRSVEFAVDAIVSFYAIFHTPRETHLDLFRTLRTYLPPGGLLLVTMGYSDWEGSEDDFCGVTMYWSHFDAATNHGIVEQSGFAIVSDEIDTTGGERHQVILARNP